MRVRYALPAGARMPAKVTFQWLDDYGTPRDQQATVSIP
jgi:chaperone protein EcpD